MNRRSSIAYIDFLSCMLVFFVIAFAVVYLKQKENQNDTNVTSKAEYVITIDWEDGSDSDIDLFVSRNGEDISYFGNRDVVGVFTLERDDLGTEGNRPPTRREITTIRSKLAGEYFVGLVYWTKRTKFNHANVKVNVIKLNPFQEIISETFAMVDQNSEQFVVSFKVDSNNNVVEINKTDSVSLVKMAKDAGFLKSEGYGSYGPWSVAP